MERLAWLKPRKMGPVGSRDNRGNLHPSFHLYTACLPELTELYKKYYPKGKKILGDSLELLEPLGMAVWYCDDGSLDHGSHRTRLSTENYTYEENKLIQSWFLSQGISCKTSPRPNDKWIIDFKAEGRSQLFQLIRKFIPEVMAYKLNLKSEAHFRFNQYYRERSQIRKKNGLCMRCGASLELDRLGKGNCHNCLQYCKDYYRLHKPRASSLAGAKR